MRKLLCFLPVAAAAVLLSGCDDVSYSERTVVQSRPAAYYGDDDADFYYVSSRPYSRSYGQLYLRDNRYYYSRGGTYHVYSRPTYAYGHRHDHFVDRDRRDWNRGRDRDWDRDRDRQRSREVQRVSVDRRERDWDHRRDERASVQVRNRQVYNVNHTQAAYQQSRVDGRNLRVNRQEGGAGRPVQVNAAQSQRVRPGRAEQAVLRQSQPPREDREGQGQGRRHRDKRDDNQRGE